MIKITELINQYIIPIGVFLFIFVIGVLIYISIRVDNVVHNTKYAKIENDSLKKVIKIQTLEHTSVIYKMNDSIGTLIDKYKKDSVFYINLYQMNWENICFFIDYFKIKHPEVVKAQILLETNYLKSEACQINKNLFGMKYVKGRLSTHSYKNFA